jgi:hybrid cluster-associated redox disulfide protein
MITLDSTVEDVLLSNTRLASLFVSHRMICVGCEIARFHTIREAAVMYEIDPALFLDELNQRMLGADATTGASNHCP